jgi:flagellar motor protein MotB
MLKNKLLILSIIIGLEVFAQAKSYANIFDEKCAIALYTNAQIYFNNSPISMLKDPRGIILRFSLENPDFEIAETSPKTKELILRIQEFLAKIKNPAIIEVHLENYRNTTNQKLKTWEISTIIANQLETAIIGQGDKVAPNRINSVGYGEFLPQNNPPNNGGNLPNRVDIIILCNISGE